MTLRTDKPEAELGLYSGEKQLAYVTWQAHRELAETIHRKIEELLNKSSMQLRNLQGIIVFKGPGSFTGLRIGAAAANALAYSYKIPIVARGGEKWRENGVKDLLAAKNDKIALPEYGALANTTKPKK